MDFQLCVSNANTRFTTARCSLSLVAYPLPSRRKESIHDSGYTSALDCHATPYSPARRGYAQRRAALRLRASSSGCPGTWSRRVSSRASVSVGGRIFAGAADGVEEDAERLIEAAHAGDTLRRSTDECPGAAGGSRRSTRKLLRRGGCVCEWPAPNTMWLGFFAGHAQEVRKRGPDPRVCGVPGDAECHNCHSPARG